MEQPSVTQLLLRCVAAIAFVGAGLAVLVGAPAQAQRRLERVASTSSLAAVARVASEPVARNPHPSLDLGTAGLSLHVEGDNFTWGDSVTLDATVTDQSGSCTHDPFPGGCDVPTGSVQFYDHGVAIPGAIGTLSGTVFFQSDTSVTISDFSVGDHEISAAYIPGNFAALSEATYASDHGYKSFSVATASCASRFTLTAGAKEEGAFFTYVPFTATLPSNATGTIAFYVGSSNVAADQEPVSNGSATYRYGFGQPGSVTIHAIYFGDNHYNVCQSPDASYTLEPPTTASGEVRVPTASPDFATTDAGHPVNIDVLSNDNLGNGAPMTITVTSPPGHGTASVNSSNLVVYTPAGGFSGADTFRYKIADRRGYENGPTTVSVTVRCVASGMADSYTVDHATTLTADAPGVLANDTPCDGGATAAGQPTHGTLHFSHDGGFTYSPDADFTGGDSFSYRLDKNEAATITVTLLVAPKACATSLADDVYTATDGALDVPAPGVAGNDTLCGATLAASAQPVHGSLTFGADGAFSYHATSGYTGPDQFQYGVTSTGGRTALAVDTVATVHLDVIAKLDPTTTTTIPPSTATTAAGSATTLVASEAPFDPSALSPALPVVTTPPTMIAALPTADSIDTTRLPRTGSSTRPALLLAGFLLLIGAACMYLSRRRPSTVRG